MTESNNFIADPGFCYNCGSILPMLGDEGGVNCYNCKTSYGPETFGAMKSHYVIHFNSRDAYKDATEKKSAGAEGPVVDRICPKCNNNKMSYATLQLRSADEGQTVFYTCTKCRFKESENS